MLRDTKLIRRRSGKNPQEGNENLPSADRTDSSSVFPALDPTRPPLNTIVGSTQNPRNASDHESDFRFKAERTPSKRAKMSDSSLFFRTPERIGTGSNKRRIGGVRETGSEAAEDQEEGIAVISQHSSVVRAFNYGNGSLMNTPRIARSGTKTGSNYSESGSTHSTPSKSVTKPSNPSFIHPYSSKPPLNIGSRNANYLLMSKGISSSSAPTTIVNTSDVPHFELKEDPSFWMDHNVQVNFLFFFHLFKNFLF